MPAGNIRDENLEERIERIRRRDEEIEKKHREAEEDRLAALQANAMVKTTAPTDDEWPKAHKYDKLDFTYDVKNDDIDDATNKKNGDDAARLQRNYKKFPDGQGPPADPTYNFLADAERDGVPAKGTVNSVDTDKKDWRANNTGNNLNRKSTNSSFNKGRNGGRNKSGNFHGQQRGSGGGGSNDEYNSWKNERDRYDESRVNRQKSGEGKWRREWDNDKVPAEISNSNKGNDGCNVDDRQIRFKVGAPINSNSSAVPSQINDIKAKQFNSLPQKLSELNIEKRGNITVSISQDGEVKSVKCKCIEIGLQHFYFEFF